MMHLPNLLEYPLASVTAVCDRKQEVLDAVGDRFGIRRRYTSVTTFLDEEADRLDGVLVCTPSHTREETALPVLERGIPIFVEKPLAMTPDVADELVAAADNDTTAMVGYMKRYHPTVTEAYRKIDKQESIDHVELYDVDPDHGRIIQEIHSPVGEPPGSVPPTRAEKIAAVIGTDDSRLVDAYSFQIEHICHDVNLLRGAFDDVTEIAHVDIFNGSRYLTAALRCGDVRCSVTSGTASRKWFEEYLRVDTPSSRLKLEFDNPFKRHAPPSLEFTQGEESYEQMISRPSYQDSFALEMDHFVRCLEGKSTSRTPLEEAAADIDVVASLFEMFVEGC